MRFLRSLLLLNRYRKRIEMTDLSKVIQASETIEGLDKGEYFSEHEVEAMKKEASNRVRGCNAITVDTFENYLRTCKMKFNQKRYMDLHLCTLQEIPGNLSVLPSISRGTLQKYKDKIFTHAVRAPDSKTKNRKDGIAEFYNHIAFVVALLLMHGIRKETIISNPLVKNYASLSKMIPELILCWDFSSSFLGTYRKNRAHIALLTDGDKDYLKKNHQSVSTCEPPNSKIQQRSVPYGVLTSAGNNALHCVALVFRDKCFPVELLKLFEVTCFVLIYFYLVT